MNNHPNQPPSKNPPLQYKKPRNLKVWEEGNSIYGLRPANMTPMTTKANEEIERSIYDIYMPKSGKHKSSARLITEDEPRRQIRIVKTKHQAPLSDRYHTDNSHVNEPLFTKEHHPIQSSFFNQKIKVKSNVVRTAHYDYTKGDLEVLDIHHLNPKTELPEYVATQIVGRNVFVKGSFGDKLKLYVDYASSGQDLKFIQDEIAKLEELYANTHTDASFVGAHMHHLVSQAEAMILKECKANPKDYFIISGNSGNTYAIEMTQKIFGAFLPTKFKEQLSEIIDSGDQDQSLEEVKNKLRAKEVLPVILVSSFEHQFEEVSWEKQLCDYVQIPFSNEGLINIEELEKMLKEYRQTKRPIICSISAGSNVTGVKADVLTVGKLCKKHEAIIIVDYTSIGAYIPIDLSHKSESGKPLLDAVYLAPHKFLGGPGTLGLLILNKQVYHGNLQPTHGGGGTVDIVGLHSEVYIEDYAEREKSGTPGILQIIKTALVFQLKGMLQEVVEKNTEMYLDIFRDKVCSNKNFVLLESGIDKDQVPIISFNIKNGERFLHHNLVVRLLNDIFGIQSRSGCPCAESYAQYLFNMDKKTSQKHEFLTQKDHSVLCFRPGGARIALHYILMPYEVEYICFALNYLCEHGAKFLPLYNLDPSTGIWTHKSSNWAVPTLRIGKILNETRTYAKDEEGRIVIFENQKKEAITLLDTLPKSKGLDVFEEAGELCKFYAEKGNVL